MKQLDLFYRKNRTKLDEALSIQKNFEDSLCIIEKKKNGIFLTEDPKVIRAITKEIKSDEDLLRKTILEPSCGHGAFFVEILLEIHERGIDAQKASNFISNNLFFCDIKDEMILATKNMISSLYQDLYDVSFSGNFNAFCLDFTKDLRNELCPKKLSDMLMKFDYVVGNPPFVTLYGRRDKKESEGQREYLLNKFEQFPKNLKNGKINLSMIFIENAIHFLKPEGHLSFVLDISFFELAFEHTRKFLLENTKIKYIGVGLKSFNAASGQIILKFTKGYEVGNVVEIEDCSSGKIISESQDTWYVADQKYKFSFQFNGAIQKILNNIESAQVKSIKEIFPDKNLRTCCMLLDMEDKFTFKLESAESQSGEKKTAYPYFEGSKSLSAKFNKLIFSKYFYYNKKLQDKINDQLKVELALAGIKNKKRIGLGESIIYDNPKVFIRQSAKEIIASYCEGKGAANNSLYVFTLRSNTPKDIVFLKFLTGYFNSTIASFYSQAKGIIRYQPGKQPQIKTSDIYSLPIPTSEELQRKISDITDLIYANEICAKNGIEKIDKLIFEYFELSKKEVAEITSFYQSFLTN